MKIITTENKSIKLWLEDIEEDALRQAKYAANLPFTFSHVAIMPDSHVGYSLPIGGVLATTDVIIPSAVGVDISCSVSVCRTSLYYLNTEDRLKILGGSKEYHGGTKSLIPVGINKQSKKQEDWLSIKECTHLEGTIVKTEYEKSLKQIGTLGGGKMNASSPRE